MKLCDVSIEDATIVKAIEVEGYGNIKPTNHDVKAVELIIQQKLNQFENIVPFVHLMQTLSAENLSLLIFLGCVVSILFISA